MMQCELSVIFPFRCEEEQSVYILDRLEEICKTLPTTDNRFEFMVVDSGSKDIYRARCRALCERYSLLYLYHDTEGEIFSIGACRDFGATHANGKAVSFFDVDLRVTDDFWDRLLILMHAWKISDYKKSFLAVPCLYLTQEGSLEFQNASKETRHLDFYLRYLQGDRQAIENFALCSSVMIVDRLHYLSIGGHDPEFRGHGYEDFELYHRLLCEENVVPKPPNYYDDKKAWNTFTYTGFRSHLSIIGRPALMCNLFVVHIWHPRFKTTSFYKSNELMRNRTIWVDKFKEFEKNGFHPEPLIHANSSNNTILYFGKPKSNSTASLKDIFPLLGKPIFVSEHDFISENGTLLTSNFTSMLTNYGISRIVFPNPYGNPARLQIYNWCRETHFPYLCYDRGALPDSWFFDENGFNAESKSYSASLWDKDLTAAQTNLVKTYISECLAGDNILEKQNPRIGVEALSAKLKIGSKKVLFVPLQRPSDTVIKYLAGQVETYDRFLRYVNDLAQILRSMGWIVLCKKHPLETQIPDMPNVTFVPEDTNFIDLIELSEGVALINSGVGIYAMMLQKPCYIFGDAFYAIPGVNKNVVIHENSETQNIRDLADEIISGHETDMNKVYQFVHYLKESFYSFGKPRMKIVNEIDGSLRNLTTNIDFYDIKLPGQERLVYNAQDRPRLYTSAPMFDQYGLDVRLRKKDTHNQIQSGASLTTKNLIQQKGKERKGSKFEKFKRNPYAFFADSKHPTLRWFKVFYRKS